MRTCDMIEDRTMKWISGNKRVWDVQAQNVKQCIRLTESTAVASIEIKVVKEKENKASLII